MTSDSEESPDRTSGIDDDQLPDDLQPTDENPLAQPLDDDAPDPDELDVLGGKAPEASEGEDGHRHDGDGDGDGDGQDSDDA